MQFAAPDTPGQTDHVMVLLTVDNSSIGAMETDTGEVSHDGYVQGFVSVTPE